MTFSLDGRYATKQEAIDDLTARFAAEVVPANVGHALDKLTVLAAAKAHLDLVTQKPDHDLLICVSGNIGWDGMLDGAVTAPTELHLAGVSVSVGQVARPPA